MKRVGIPFLMGDISNLDLYLSRTVCCPVLEHYHHLHPLDGNGIIIGSPYSEIIGSQTYIHAEYLLFCGEIHDEMAALLGIVKDDVEHYIASGSYH